MKKISQAHPSMINSQLEILIPLLENLDGVPVKYVILSLKNSGNAKLVIPALLSFVRSSKSTPRIYDAKSAIRELSEDLTDAELLIPALDHPETLSLALECLKLIGNQSTTEHLFNWVKMKN